jgi:mono/diheme cytochrome c family protein
VTGQARNRRGGLVFAVVVLAASASGAAFAAGEAATNPVPSSNPLSGEPEAIDKGHELYATWCAQCHGPRADGVSERWGSYAADLRVFWRGYDEFVTITKEGRPDKQMPPWEGVLNEDQIAQIGAYLETLAMEGANWQ